MTTIKVKNTKQTPFGRLSVSDIFLYSNYVAIKIESFTLPNTHTVINAIDLYTGIKLTFLDTTLVDLVKEVNIDV
jgi:hypothetical protein